MNRHETDALSLGLGLAFVIFAGWAQLVASIDVDLPTLGWFIAGALILCGLLGVFTTLRSQHHHSHPPSSP